MKLGRKSLAERAAAPAAVRIPSRDAEWRSLTRADVDAVVGLLHQSEAADGSAVRTTHAEIEDLFAANHSAYGAFDDDGELIAYGYVRLEDEPGGIEALCSGAVHPDWRGRRVGSGIVEWQIDTARHMLATSGREGNARIVHVADESVAGIGEILRENGFAAREWSTVLRRDLSEPINEIELARTLVIEPWTPVWDDAVRRVNMQAFDGLDLHPAQLEHARRGWSFVALDKTSDRAKIAGYVVASCYEEDFPLIGFSEATIEAVSVLANWRGQRVGRSLVTHVLQAALADGMEYVSLDTDSSDDPSVSALYADTGFAQVTRSTHYVIEL